MSLTGMLCPFNDQQAIWRLHQKFLILFKECNRTKLRILIWYSNIILGFFLYRNWTVILTLVILKLNCDIDACDTETELWKRRLWYWNWTVILTVVISKLNCDINACDIETELWYRRLWYWNWTVILTLVILKLNCDIDACDIETELWYRRLWYRRLWYRRLWYRRLWYRNWKLISQLSDSIKIYQ